MQPDMSNGIVTIYQVEYRQEFASDQSSVLLRNTTLLTYTVTGLSPFTEYRFRVAAFTRARIGNYTPFINNFTTGKFSRNSPYLICLYLQNKVETYIDT